MKAIYCLNDEFETALVEKKLTDLNRHDID